MLLSLPMFGQRAFTLFTDCDCDFNYLSQQIPYVAHTQVPTGADVRLLVADGGTGGGGRRYDLTFTGLKAFQGITKEVSFQTEANSSDDRIRNQLVEAVKRGILPYLLETDLADDIQYSVAVSEEVSTDLVVANDWDSWVLGVYAEGEYESESAQSELYMEFGLEADRITEANRIRIDARTDYLEREIEQDSSSFFRIRRNWLASGSMVWSLSPHWSLGGFGGYSHSTFDNIDNSYFVSPAIEFNIYPYSEVLRREISAAYRIGYRYNDYLETTVFEKDDEGLYYTSLYMQARFRQPWGNINASLEGSAFLQDLSKNRLELDSYVDLNLYRGLALRLSVETALIRDQINLAAGDASVEDVLLRQRQIATNFRAEIGIGVSYTFGYLTNNIINYRL